jgi:26S proteasome regulatory subunit N2
MSVAVSISTMSSSNAMTNSAAAASGYLALLQEDDVTLQSHALSKLLECVDTQWHQVAQALSDLEALAENANLPPDSRQTAAAVASRVFFYLDEPTQALRLALQAGESHFDPMQTSSPYVQRLVTAALDAYIQIRQQKEGEEAQLLTLEQLQPMMDRLLERSCQAGRYDHALGIALEARETDKLRDILKACPSLLNYAIRTITTLVSSKTFRTQALQVVAERLDAEFDVTSKKNATAPDLVKVHQLLGQAKPVADVLSTLLSSADEDCALLGLQLCFDLMDSGDQAFVQSVSRILFPTVEGDDNQDTSATVSPAMAQAKRVLVDGFASELALSFLHKESRADRLIMENLKKTLEERSSGSRSSILHNAAVVAHSYLYAGTTNDSFLRDYLDWMKKASNW